MQQTTINIPSERPLAFRVDDFCRKIGIGRTTFYELIKEKKIKTVIIGGRRLVPATEADRLLSEGMQ